MEFKDKLLKEGYKKYQQPEGEPTLYQKKVCDKKGIKYFINCSHYKFPEGRAFPSWEFKIQLNTKVGTYNITLFNAGNIAIMNMETIMELEWINHGAKYYEEFVSSEKAD